MARCVILVAFGPFSKGQVIPDVPANQAARWVELNRARIEQEAPASRAQSSPVNRMVTTFTNKRQRGRG